MFLPIFIAILMGLLSPINQSSDKLKGTVYVKMDAPSSQPNTFSTDSIPPEEGGGETGIGGGTGGENSPIIPPKPPKP